MLDAGVKLIKGILALALAAVVFQWAQRVATVEVTLVADGSIQSVPVGADDPLYRDESDLARKKALPVHALAAVVGLVGLAMLRSSYRTYRSARST